MKLSLSLQVAPVRRVRRRRPRPRYALYKWTSRRGRMAARPWRVYLSAATLPAGAGATDDLVCAEFKTERQCDDFMRTAYHQRKPWREVLP